MEKAKHFAFVLLLTSLFTAGLVILFSAAKHSPMPWGASQTGVGLLLATLALWLSAHSPDSGRARAGFAFSLTLTVLVAWFGWYAIAAEQVELRLGSGARIGLQICLMMLLLRWKGHGVGAPLVTLFGLPQAKSRREDWEERIRSVAAQEERHRLARDLHDAIKQQIFAVQTTVAAAQSRLETDPGGARQALDQARAAARDATAEMQALLEQLHSTPVEITGLVEAVKHHAEALRLRTDAQVDVTIGVLPAPEVLPAGATEAYFRIAQEALANVARHARARQVKVFLGVEANALRLRVEDDGQGFDAAGAAGMGLGNIRTRAEELGAVADITTAVGQGTRVGVYLPLDVPVEVPIHENKHYRLAVGAITGAVVGVAIVKEDPKLAVFLLIPLVMWLPVWLGRRV